MGLHYFPPHLTWDKWKDLKTNVSKIIKENSKNNVELIDVELKAHGLQVTSKIQGQPWLVSEAQWIGREPASQRVAGSIPTQDAHLSCGLGLQLGAHGGQPRIDLSLPLFPSPSL